MVKYNVLLAMIKKMEKTNKKLIMGTVLIISLMCGIGAGCIDKDVEMDSINIYYPVRDVHFGYVNGESIIAVEYIDGDTIKLVDNKMSTKGDHKRINEILVKTIGENDSYLLFYARSTNPKEYIHPRGRYILYLNNNTKLEGFGSNNPHPDRPDEETFLS